MNETKTEKLARIAIEITAAEDRGDYEVAQGFINLYTVILSEK